MRKKLIVVFLVFGIVFSMPSKAIVPLLVAVGLVDAAGALTTTGYVTSALTGIGLAGIIGQRMGLLSLSDSAGGKLLIPLTPQTRDRPVSNPNLPISQPVTNPATTVSSLVCPATSIGTVWCANGGTCTYTETTIYVSATATTCTFTTTASNVSVIPNQYNITNGFRGSGSLNKIVGCNAGYNYSTGQCIRAPTTPSCSTGYTESAGSCVLTVPEAIPDTNCSLKVSTSATGSTYISNATDPDCGGGAALPDNRYSFQDAALIFQLSHSNAPINPDGTSSNSPVAVAVIPSGGSSMCPYQICIPVAGLPGHFRISALSNSADGSGRQVVIDVNEQTGIVTQANVVSLAGQVIGSGQSYTNSSGQNVTLGANQYAVVNASGSTYVQSSTTALPATVINTSDLAKTGEAAAAAAGVVNALNSNLQANDIDVLSPMTSINASLDAVTNNLTPKDADQPVLDFSWLPSFLPGTYQACAPFPIDVNPTIGAAAGLVGHGEIDICSKLDFARQFLGWLLGVFTVFSIFRAFVNANKAAL